MIRKDTKKREKKKTNTKLSLFYCVHPRTLKKHAAFRRTSARTVIFSAPLKTQTRYFTFSTLSICSSRVTTTMTTTTPTLQHSTFHLSKTKHFTKEAKHYHSWFRNWDIQAWRNEIAYSRPFSWSSSRARGRSQSPRADLQCKPLTLSTTPWTSVEQVILCLTLLQIWVEPQL